MPPRTSLLTPLRGWQCPHCRSRTFATSPPRRAAFGPEHPRYIEVPESPQQSLPYRPFIKGRLPIPRNVLSGKDGLKRADDEQIAKATQLPQRQHDVEAGSREEWKRKMSDARRRNLREGLKGLRARTVSKQQQKEEWDRRDALERAELRSRPEREDERLTAPSHGLDLERLLHGPLEDPTREERLKQKERNVTLHTSAQRAERLDHLHTLYMNARTFIVTPEQLDAVIEEEFNKDFTRLAGTYAQGETNSVWAYGAPMTLQAMLNKEHRGGGRLAYDGSDVNAETSRKRIRRIAEKLTGGKMESEGKEFYPAIARCDKGAGPTTGFEASCNGTLTHQGQDTFWSYPTGDNGGFNIYKMPISGEPHCVPIWLIMDGCPPSCPQETPKVTPAPPSPPKARTKCPAELNGSWEFPHLIVPVDSAEPERMYRTQYNGTASGTTSSIFNFDIPLSYAGKECSLEFLFPTHEQLETSSYELKADLFSVAFLDGVANQDTNYVNKPKILYEFGQFMLKPGTATLIGQCPGGCAAGKAVSFMISPVGEASLSYFQDSNPCPIGLYVTAQ